MQPYDQAALDANRAVMQAFSTSFGLASRLFPKSYRQDIYNIYGLVRIADEIVDSYDGSDAAKQLTAFEEETYAAMECGFSTNLVIHAFALTARTYDIGKDIVKPFYASMRADLKPHEYKPEDYETYIYGSAEVVGLMCLKVFCAGDRAAYDHLMKGARALGSAFQKVNFLRDLAADQRQLGRYYFPIGSYKVFDETTKQQIIDDIKTDFATARPAIQELPNGSKAPVLAAYRYYHRLLETLESTPAADLKTQRVRINNATKLFLLAGSLFQTKAGR